MRGPIRCRGACQGGKALVLVESGMTQATVSLVLRLAVSINGFLLQHKAAVTLEGGGGMFALVVGSSAPPMSMSYDRGLSRVAGCRLLPRTSHCASCTASATCPPARAAPQSAASQNPRPPGPSQFRPLSDLQTTNGTL